MTETHDAEPAATSRGERRRARTRLAILDAAEAVFRDAGFHGARVEEIAERADVSVGSIYLHFAGKQGVFLALVERSLDVFSSYMDETEAPELGPLQRVLAGGDAYLRFHLDHPGLFHFVTTGVPGGGDADADPETAARIAERVSGLLARFAGLVDAAIAAGEVVPLDSHRLTRFLWGAWNGVIALRQQPTGLALTEDEVARTLELGRWLLREAVAAPALRDGDGAVGDRVPLPFTGAPQPPTGELDGRTRAG
jgi:AcrR family transcriptional regulator